MNGSSSVQRFNEPLAERRVIHVRSDTNPEISYHHETFLSSFRENE